MKACKLPPFTQFSSVTQSCLTLCDPMDCSMPGLPVHHQLRESTQTPVHWVGEAIQPSHLLSSSPPALNLSQQQGLFKWVSCSHQVARVLELQLDPVDINSQTAAALSPWQVTSESVSLLPGRCRPALQGAGSPACLQHTDASALFFFLLFLSSLHCFPY